jgi:hypothetical protein
LKEETEVEKESPILESLTVLENELLALAQQLKPLMVIEPPPTQLGVGSTGPVEPERSQVNARLTTMIRQVRDLQQRLE